jgi:hypothetical protein
LASETILITNMNDERLAYRRAETVLGISQIEAGRRIVLAVDVSGKKQPLRLSDVGAFEVRALIEADMRKHLAEIDEELEVRRERRRK